MPEAECKRMSPIKQSLELNNSCPMRKSVISFTNLHNVFIVVLLLNPSDPIIQITTPSLHYKIPVFSDPAPEKS